MSWCLYLFSCGPTSNNPKSSEEQKQINQIDESNFKYVDWFNQNLNRHNKWNSNASWQRNYTIDGDSINQQRYLESCKMESIAHVFESIQSIQHIQAPPSSDKSAPTVIFDYKSILKSFSPEYVEAHHFSPNFIDLYVNEYNNIFLSLGTRQAGEMSTTVYTKSTGHRLSHFYDKDYKGTYLIGNLINEMDSIDDARAVLMVGDSIFIQDFSKEQLLRETTFATK